jgi:hypothetical protein
MLFRFGQACGYSRLAVRPAPPPGQLSNGFLGYTSW